ncbi:MAG TPA: ion channel [Solirubrobacteraceae bacterium]|nr:ion channel [Solirubrobacteraceae bacterium]
MGTLAVIVGVIIVLVVALDMGLVVLHPTVQGPISHRVTRMIWRASRGLAVALRRPRLLIFGGPLTTVGLLFWWLAGFWIGFALIYLPFIGHFSASVHFGHKGFFDALYTSATMLTTLGLGELLPTQDAMRVAVVCEAATGVGTVSAAISYILSVYPLATQTRAHALYLSDLELVDPRAAAQYLDAAGDSGLAEIHQRLIDGHQSLRRFPVLYYFHPDREAESIKRLLESAAVLCAVARWAPPDALTHYGHRLAEALRSTLERVARDYETRYIAGRSGRTTEDRVPDDAAVVLAALRRDTLATEPVTTGSSADAGFGEFLTQMSNLLGGLANAHLYPRQPLAARFSGSIRTNAAPPRAC